VGLDVDGFVRNGYLAICGAFDTATAAACRRMIWESLRIHDIHEKDPATWPPLARIGCLEGEPLTAAGTSPVLAAAYDELIGPGRWTRPVNADGAVAVRFPSQDRAECGYHIEGSYDGPGGYWVNVRSRARGLLALLLFTDVGPHDAPTRLVCGSHLYVPEFLGPHGEPGTNADGRFWRPSVLCRPVAHATGQAGDAFLCHPFLVHTATWPHAGSRPRMIAQPAVPARDGFVLDGTNSSPVARAIMAGLAMAGQT
jgi:hypothetical protein